ncbi:hypothetical protein BH10ACT3_BH10ACT3_04610 [soil metagenome]
MATDRFHDDAVRLDSFVTPIDVVCPSYGARAAVRSADDDAPARVVCRHCSFATDQHASGWLGAVEGIVDRRCPSCGERLERRVTGPRHDHPTHLRSACGWESDAVIWWEPVRSEGTDPMFGLDLWLRAPFRGDLLWAYNAEHLQFLKNYVTARVREREPKQNSSLASRLPKWIKSAKNRDDLVAAIEKLEARSRLP